MSSTIPTPNKRPSHVLLGMLFLAGSCIPAYAGDPIQILKSMTDYVAKQPTISLAFDSDIEVITPELQKLQFTSSSQLLLSRPDKLRIERTGSYADIELVYDGKTATLYGKDTNNYAQQAFTGSMDQLVEELRATFNVQAPGADLLLSNSFSELTAGVIEAKHIGTGIIDGVECEHLAFRNEETDWQIWIETGPTPVPRKYVITSKAVTLGPQYTLRIHDWKAGASVAADAFAFKPAADARKIDVSKLEGFDEVPAGVTK
jgi:hypothetical protein